MCGKAIRKVCLHEVGALSKIPALSSQGCCKMVLVRQPQSVRCRWSVCVFFFSARYRFDAALCSLLVRRFGSAFAIGSVSVCIGFGFGAAFCIVETAMVIYVPF